MRHGVIYVATGRKYIDEALQSMASLKAATPSVHVTLFSDEDVKSPWFDELVRIEAAQERDETFRAAASTLPMGMINKVYYMARSPYDRTLFLDTDTYVVNDISDMFPLLERFDIAVTHAPHRSLKALKAPLAEVPASFPVLNTGVILFRRSERLSAFFSEWLRLYPDVKYAGCNDQAPFREALYHSDLRVATLTPEYNYRFGKRLAINGVLKIIHGRHPNLPQVAKRADAIVARGIAPPLVDPLAPSMWSKVRKRLANPL